MRISHNISALNTYGQLQKNANAASKSMEKLSSGFRINRAGDDAAGLAISEKMRAQIRGLNQASRNAQDGISLIQTAEGAMGQTHDILQRIRELGVQGSSESYDTNDLSMIQAEVDDLIDEIGNIGSKTEFNGSKLLDGTANFDISIDQNGSALNITIGNMQATALGGTNTLDTFKTGGTNALAANTNARDLITAAEEAIKTVSTERSKLGAKQNRLEYTINNLSTASENLTAAESRIRDTDMAKEMMEFTKNNILQQAAQAMMAQANQQPQNVLNLLR
ncbi:flagellin [Cytobacillus sp. FJAT-54145]|uniref:Flagellin n=1 Tax=Cytobacillus spartinae TaxID=3299023 RepID=A0ABW6KEH0_9BACI